MEVYEGDDYELQCDAIVSAFKDNGINFLALDFDDTLISFHTYGKVDRIRTRTRFTPLH